MSKIKVTYIISFIDKAVAFEWISEKLNKSRFELSFILLNSKPSLLGQFLKEKKISMVELTYHGIKKAPSTIRLVKNILKEWKPDVVHTHLIDANLIGLVASRWAGIEKRIFTRHNSTYHRNYFKKGILLDKLSIKLSTHIISISENVSEVLMTLDNAPRSKIRLIHHGFDLEKIKRDHPKLRKSLNAKFNPSCKSPVIGVVSRYMHWKGIQYIIPAFKKILVEYPDALLMLVGSGSGDHSNQIRQSLKELPTDSYCETGFVNEFYSVYKLFDVFVHVPISHDLEAFGQIYIEALAAGIPSVVTCSGIAKEFMIHEQNCLIVDFENSNDIHNKVIQVLKDDNLKNFIIQNGKECVDGKFDLNTMIEKLEEIYSE